MERVDRKYITVQSEANDHKPRRGNRSSSSFKLAAGSSIALGDGWLSTKMILQVLVRSQLAKPQLHEPGTCGF